MRAVLGGELVHVHSLKDKKSMFPARQGLHIGNEENRTAIVLAIAGLIELLRITNSFFA